MWATSAAPSSRFAEVWVLDAITLAAVFVLSFVIGGSASWAVLWALLWAARSGRQESERPSKSEAKSEFHTEDGASPPTGAQADLPG
jgi:hypothetical protein